MLPLEMQDHFSDSARDADLTTYWNQFSIVWEMKFIFGASEIFRA